MTTHNTPTPALASELGFVETLPGQGGRRIVEATAAAAQLLSEHPALAELVVSCQAHAAGGLVITMQEQPHLADQAAALERFRGPLGIAPEQVQPGLADVRGYGTWRDMRVMVMGFVTRRVPPADAGGDAPSGQRHRRAAAAGAEPPVARPYVTTGTRGGAR